MKARVVFLVILSVIYGAEAEKAIRIENGPIVADESDDFYAFRGIPYAEPPVGNLRFAPPVPFAAKWTENRAFKEFGPICAQYDHLGYAYRGEEDCLTLNVFVPKTVLDGDEKVPVIFFIHGGAFMFGTSQKYGPEIIMKEQNMILVTLNYRVGILGFLSTEDSVIPGNYGLKDQVEALRWVQKNIAAFNGDPRKVTLAGWSAGGASVHLHYMSPQSDDLFNNGISHSGNALDPWVMAENSEEKAHQVAAFMDCPQKHRELIKCLREKPAEDLVMLVKKFQPFLYNPFSPFGVVVEPKSEKSFLLAQPQMLLERGSYKHLPWLLSQTQDEGLYPAFEFFDDEVLKTLTDRFYELAPFFLDFNGTTTNQLRKKQMSEAARRRYVGVAPVSKATYVALRDMLTDRLFKHGAFKSLKLQAGHSTAYFYHFLYKTLFTMVPNENLGVAHGEDVFLIYKRNDRTEPFTDGEVKVSKNLLSLYFNFANSNEVVFGGVKADKVNPKSVQGLEITDSGEGVIVDVDDAFGSGPFWEDLEKTLNTEEKTYHDEF